MTIASFLIDNVSNTGETVRPALSALAGWAQSGRPLGANSGPRPGTPSTTGSATGTTWTVGPHSGILDLETAAIAGPYFYAITAAETGSLTAASTSNPRVDLVTLRVNDPIEDGSSTAGIVTKYYPGTPASSPSAPATPTGEFALMTISVPKSGTGSPSVTWVATPFDDTGWLPLTLASAYAGGGTNAQARYQRGQVRVVGSVTRASGAISTSSPETVATLPASIPPPPFGIRVPFTAGGAVGYVQIGANSNVIQAVANSGTNNVVYLPGLSWFID